MTMETGEKTEPRYKNPLKILVIRINLANTANHNQFIYSIQFNVEKTETYTRAIKVPNAAK